MSKPLKAYHVSEPDEGYGAIVYATNSATARREGANELNIEWEDVDTCRRAPEFDQFAPGPVPKMAMLASGWWFTCYHCDRKISEDMAEELEDAGLDSAQFGAVEDATGIYCSSACQMARFHERRDAIDAIDALIELVEARFAGAHVTSCHVYGTRLAPSETGHGMRCFAEFTFPGGTYPARWVFGESVAHVSRCDLEAFQQQYRPRDAAEIGRSMP